MLLVLAKSMRSYALYFVINGVHLSALPWPKHPTSRSRKCGKNEIHECLQTSFPSESFPVPQNLADALAAELKRQPKTFPG